MTTPTIGLIWAQARDGIIGADGGMPWHVPEDLAHFKATTHGSPVVMGRRTWDSLPERFRPLPGRTNIVVTRQPNWHAEGAVTVGNVEDAFRAAGDVPEIWVMGGGQIYRETIERAQRLEVTELDLTVDGDTQAPSTAGFTRSAAGPWSESTSGIRYRFTTYIR